MKLFNYLSKKIEEFTPTYEIVGLYTCGPTVYDFVHIGNWRTFIFEDILKRVLIFNEYKVKHVMNITDIDDKIIAKSQELGLGYREIADKYEKAFFADLAKLNIIRADVYPKATNYISSMIQIIELLLKGGFAYKGDDGIYFAVEKFKDYGKLSGLERKNLKKGARIDADLYDKESWADFALWKFPSARFARSGRVPEEPSWEVPFGRGRPGWHIECSAMSMQYLGNVGPSRTIDPSTKLRVDRFKTIDIHTGGVDLLFPHHENEIAQSEAATGKKFVNFWFEGEHLLVEGEKMAKSLGNIYTMSDIIKKGFEPLALRYLFLTAHYRSKLNFTWRGLAAAQNALDNLRETVVGFDKPAIGCAGFEKDFGDAVNNDLDMPRALAVMWEMIASDYPTSAKHQSLLVMDKILGLGLGKIEKVDLSKKQRALVEMREQLRKAGKFVQADRIRSQLLSEGIVIEDTSQGVRWKKRRNKIDKQ